MKAEDAPLTSILSGPKQFIIPIFQRDYSWGTKHCLQLWDDIVRAGSDRNAKAHFVGSVVYIAAEESTANIPRWLLIDGQQRLTTLTLLLAAIRDFLPQTALETSSEAAADAIPSRPELDDYYLRNQYGKGDRRYKLHLRRQDHESLVAILDGKELLADGSDRIYENFEFFQQKLLDCDLVTVYRGVRKLLAVDVSLVRGQDDPQMIFESLNSTGLDLTQADLIRNFILMRQEEAVQTRLYEDHWRPLERAFGGRYGTDFDKFARDYLMLRLRPARPFKAGEIYQHFRTYWHSVTSEHTPNDVLRELKRFGQYYARFNFDQEPDETLKAAQGRLRRVVDVASPVIIRLYDCFESRGTLSLSQFVSAVGLLESYVFRRAICDMQTRNLGQIFMSLANRLRDDNPFQSLQVVLHQQGKNRHFPSDTEFREALESRDLYQMRLCHYLLGRLETNSKETADIEKYTIEHIMPQNPNLDTEWRTMLGPDWVNVQARWLHRLGNLTLSGYNTEYRDRPFNEKKTMKGGFEESPLRLNRLVRDRDKWSPVEIEARGHHLAKEAVSIWPALHADLEAVRRTELEDRKAAAAQYDVSSAEFDAVSLSLFQQLRPRLLALGDDVIELFGPRHVTYRVYDFVLQVLPRRGRLYLLFNLDFSDIDDPSSHAEDATAYAFVINASEDGGVALDVRTVADIPAAVHLARQAYEAVAE
jgi:predicted transport protein